MGAGQSQVKKVNITQNQFQTNVIKIQSYLEMRRDHRQNQLNQKEKTLVQMIGNKDRFLEQELSKAESATSDAKYIRACQILIRFCEILKDRSKFIINSQGQYLQVQPLHSQFESIIFASGHLDIQALSEFQKLLISFFGLEAYENTQKLTNVDKELQQCFMNPIPSKLELHKYLADFCNRQGMLLEKLNEAGHNISMEQLMDSPSILDFKQGQTQNQQFNQQMPIFPNQHGNPQMGGMPSQMHYQQQNFPQQIPQQLPVYPQQMPHQQANFPQQMPQQQNNYPQQMPQQMNNFSYQMNQQQHTGQQQIPLQQPNFPMNMNQWQPCTPQQIPQQQPMNPQQGGQNYPQQQNQVPNNQQNYQQQNNQQQMPQFSQTIPTVNTQREIPQNVKDQKQEDKMNNEQQNQMNKTNIDALEQRLNALRQNQG